MIRRLKNQQKKRTSYPAFQHTGKSVSLSDMIRQFLLSYLPRQKGASPNTLTSYGQALKQWLDFLQRKKKIKNPTTATLIAPNVLEFLALLEERNNIAPPTRNARLAAIFSFTQFAYLMGAVSKDMYDHLRLISFKRLIPHLVSYLESEELDAIFRSVDHKTKDGFRDFAILKVLYNTGARASEIANLKISSLDLSEKLITIFGKGQKERRCCLWESTISLLRIYLATERRKPLPGYEEYLFVNQRHQPFTRFGIHALVCRYAKKAALTCPSMLRKNISPHLFRHTTAVHMLEAGVDLTVIRDWLGHAHVSTTEVYARATLKMKRKALLTLENMNKKLMEEIVTGRNVPVIDSGIRQWIETLQ